MLSAYVALVTAAMLASTMAFSLEIQQANSNAEKTLLTAMHKKLIDINLKNLARQALAGARGESCSEKVATASLNLQAVSHAVEEFYRARGIEIHPWAGFIDEKGNCAHCLPIEASQAVLYCNENGEVKISRSNSAQALDNRIGEAAIIFDAVDLASNLTWRTVIAEGFE